MDYEDFLALIYTPLKSIEILTDIIYLKCNEDWEMFSGEIARSNAEELLALIFAIELCAKHLLKFRQAAVKEIECQSE